MKNFALFCLLLCASVYLRAQPYNVSTTPVGLSYECTVVPNTQTLDDKDLVTWIFPDGQFAQRLIEKSGVSILNNSDKWLWTPFSNAPSGPNEVVVYVAKKGGTGTPPKRLAPTPTPGGNVGPLAPFAFSPGQNWQINRAWEFSPDNETLLILSYQGPQSCKGTPASLTLTFNPAEMTYNTADFAAYHNEIVSTTTNSVNVVNFNYDNNVNHVYLKLKLQPSVKVGQMVRVDVSGVLCGKEFQQAIFYESKGNPHDPNRKTVNHPVLCPNVPKRSDLIYTIQFQNDGSAPVNKVVIKDALPNDLEPTTVTLDNVPNQGIVLDNWSVSGNILNIKFKSLNLPGLAQTSPQHYAYDQTLYQFSFRICTKPSLPLLSSAPFFDNRADIVFYDSNDLPLPTISTNLERVTIRDISTCYTPVNSCNTVSANDLGAVAALDVSPNPFSGEFTVDLELLAPLPRFEVSLYNMHGQRVATLANGRADEGPQHLQWDASHLPSGVYWLMVQTDRGKAARKLVKL